MSLRYGCTLAELIFLKVGSLLRFRESDLEAYLLSGSGHNGEAVDGG